MDGRTSLNDDDLNGKLHRHKDQDPLRRARSIDTSVFGETMCSRLDGLGSSGWCCGDFSASHAGTSLDRNYTNKNPHHYRTPEFSCKSSEEYFRGGVVSVGPWLGCLGVDGIA